MSAARSTSLEEPSAGPASGPRGRDFGQGIPAGDYLRERARPWPWPSRVESVWTSSRPWPTPGTGRLAVLPSWWSIRPTPCSRRSDSAFPSSPAAVAASPSRPSARPRTRDLCSHRRGPRRVDRRPPRIRRGPERSRSRSPSPGRRPGETLAGRASRSTGPTSGSTSGRMSSSRPGRAQPTAPVRALSIRACGCWWRTHPASSAPADVRARTSRTVERMVALPSGAAAEDAGMAARCGTPVGSWSRCRGRAGQRGGSGLMGEWLSCATLPRCLFGRCFDLVSSARPAKRRS